MSPVAFASGSAPPARRWPGRHPGGEGCAVGLAQAKGAGSVGQGELVLHARPVGALRLPDPVVVVEEDLLAPGGFLFTGGLAGLGLLAHLPGGAAGRRGCRPAAERAGRTPVQRGTGRRRRPGRRARSGRPARFEVGEKTLAIARDLRVGRRPVERWRQAWREGGADALCSAGPTSMPKLSVAQFASLEDELGKGPVAHGFEGQRWTLARAQAVIGRRFRLTLSIATVWRLLKRHGWSWQAPARRALERDEDAVELWKQEVWPRVKAPRRRSGPGSSSRTRLDLR
ncbi:winged helix-turn-helix domain-containing protein [Kitasatospora sp. NPDC088264]|uniref:winged helix-turn-helix domain-containing protein n=1 Tax=Kitasatospora sp. NPDC088264 TaxID=3155296 RepID=UPI00343AD2D6